MTSSCRAWQRQRQWLSTCLLGLPLCPRRHSVVSTAETLKGAHGALQNQHQAQASKSKGDAYHDGKEDEGGPGGRFHLAMRGSGALQTSALTQYMHGRCTETHEDLQEHRVFAHL